MICICHLNHDNRVIIILFFMQACGISQDKTQQVQIGDASLTKTSFTYDDGSGNVQVTYQADESYVCLHLDIFDDQIIFYQDFLIDIVQSLIRGILDFSFSAFVWLWLLTSAKRCTSYQ